MIAYGPTGRHYSVCSTFVFIHFDIFGGYILRLMMLGTFPKTFS